VRQPSSLLLFLSVDVVGSTAYKNIHNRESERRTVQPWLQFFNDFYLDFPEILKGAAKDQGVTTLPSVWKTAGDELIFTVPLGCHTEALKHVAAFQLAIRFFSAETEKKNLPLGFKGCGWVAGFPVINAVVCPEEDGSRPDYIGPLVDVGFRLAKLSNRQKLVISVELALLLTTALEAPTSLNPVFFYDGKLPLKGVLFEQPYPIIWIDMLNGSQHPDEQLQGLAPRSPADRGKLAAFCKDYIESSSPHLVVPYIDGCERFRSIPPSHLEILNEMEADPQELLASGDSEPQNGDATITIENLESPKVIEVGDTK
jgi:hypothetical protein